jgi:capsular exopolysaccharide synthesis family protein
MADLQTEMDLLGLLDLVQNLQRQQIAAGVGEHGSNRADTTVTTFGPLADYQKAKQSIDELKAEYADFGRYLRPKHPKMIVLSDKITKAEALLQTYKFQSSEAQRTRRETIHLQMENLKTVIKQWEEKALDLSRRIADFDKIKSKSDRTRAQYDRLTAALHNVDVGKRVDQDMVSVLERASPSISTRPGLEIILADGFGLGLLLGLTILFVLDKLDDRIGSFIEFRSHFGEDLLGQIPREPTAEGLKLLGQSDSRHSLVESFRTLRSSIIFLPVEKARPKTLLITSATPGEGKTTIASNLAISFASSGAKTLLIDGDLRRGRLRELFELPENAGFSKVLQQRCTWQEVVMPTSTPNLSVITRGKSLAHSGEHLLGKVTDQFLQDIYSQYDYIIIDSAPVMAADDTLSLAPKIDGVIFTIRFSTSSARISRKALELLEQRQINILGLVANDVKLSEAGYGYGYYYDYRNPPEPQGLSIGA